MEASNDNVSARALEIGKAGEHLVCADLILQGYRAFLSDQGLPYDVLVDHEGRLYRVQVKSSLSAKNVNSRGRNERIAYTWSVRRRGKEGQSRLTDKDCDLLAFVALDIKTIAYFPVGVVGETMQLTPPVSTLSTKPRSKGAYEDIDHYPVSAALAGDRSFYIQQKNKITHCPHGHEYTPENSRVGSSGSVVCIECSREYSRSYQAKKRIEAKEAKSAA